MSTNFYIKGRRGNDNPKYHIGKRCASGLYCFDCGITLCKDGENGIHNSSEFYDKCPICGQKPEYENLENSSVGIELGFNKNKAVKKTGVKSCSSFTWAREMGDIKHIVDEYGTEYSLEEFTEIINGCPVQFYMYGKEFC